MHSNSQGACLGNPNGASLGGQMSPPNLYGSLLAVIKMGPGWDRPF